MKKFIITGDKALQGFVSISGSKNVITKALIAACLTDEKVIIHNAPRISDLDTAAEIVRTIGGTVTIDGHTVTIHLPSVTNTNIPLEFGAKSRVSSMFVAPLLHRTGRALVPNPGGCRLGARPIDRHVEGLRKLGAIIDYDRADGMFHAATEGLFGMDFTFEKNTHTGTETLILTAVLAKGTTTLHNAAFEPEIDDLIAMLNKMGANIQRSEDRTIIIEGVEKLHGCEYTIMPDRNELVTVAIASALTGGNILIENVDLPSVSTFLDCFTKAGGSYEMLDGAVRFFVKETLLASNIVTAPHPGFMTDWQGAWALLMTQAVGQSSIHETIYENRFSYVDELHKMGAKIVFYNPSVSDPKTTYNFNIEDNIAPTNQAIKITGKTKLHDAVLTVADLRAGATLVLAALIANGESTIFGIEHIERGYEDFAKRLTSLGALIEEGEALL